MSQIPAQYIDMCKEIAAIAKKRGVLSFGISFRPAYGSGWDSDVTMKWESGRHDEDASKLQILSTVHLHEKLDVK